MRKQTETLLSEAIDLVHVAEGDLRQVGQTPQGHSLPLPC